jgi:hypothetical protein
MFENFVLLQSHSSEISQCVCSCKFFDVPKEVYYFLIYRLLIKMGWKNTIATNAFAGDFENFGKTL